MENTPLTVLVVDDDEVARLPMAAILGNNGYHVLQAHDGAAAIEILNGQNTEIDAILSDIVMPNIDGLKLAELNFQNQFRPFVVCTMISDAATALKFLKFGVQDYLPKPMEEASLLNTVRNAINRRKLLRLFTDDETPLPGNIGAITISARLAEVHRVHDWLRRKIGKIMSLAEQRRFISFAAEFLMNAYEHGSLRLSEREKTKLLESGLYHEELRRRELECKANIVVAVSIVANEIAIHVIDDGYGFDYRHYLEMPAADVLNRLVLPNGRGIQMAMQYFDQITFSKGR